MTIIYEVNLSIKRTIFPAYMKWLKAHINEMLAIEGFTGARLLRRTDADDDNHHYTVAYELDSMESLQSYFDKHAQRMREDGLKRFELGSFTATRRIFELEEFV